MEKMTLSDLGSVSSHVSDVALAAVPEKKEKHPVRDALGRSYGTGRRKTSVARVWVSSGTGKFVVNGRSISEYFSRDCLCSHAKGALNVLDLENTFDVFSTVCGGGLSGQAGALRHGLARALEAFNPNFRSVMKPHGLMRRDPRAVERKKYGLRKARRACQFSKR